ncbi:MAG: OmpH family outer membrane protein [Flammeovirgaceae bacterium]
MKKTWVYFGGAWGLGLTLVVFALWMKQSDAPKVAYVRSAEVIEKFRGMREAGDLYQKKLSSYQANIDTLRATLERDMLVLKREANTLGKTELGLRSEQIRMQQANLIRYEQAVEQKVIEEEQVIQGAFNQINSLTEQFAKEQGYDLILGTTQDGSILYGAPLYDVTEEVIAFLNENY